MSLGIMDTVQLAATLIFAVPVGGFGLTLLAGGDLVLGGGMLLLAVLMVVLPRRLTTPSDVPGAIAGSLVGKAVIDPEDDKE